MTVLLYTSHQRPLGAFQVLLARSSRLQQELSNFLCVPGRKGLSALGLTGKLLAKGRITERFMWVQ